MVASSEASKPSPTHDAASRADARHPAPAGVRIPHWSHLRLIPVCIPRKLYTIRIHTQQSITMWGPVCAVR